jgi:hypothetical protein
MQFIGLVEHFECCSPTDIAMQWYLQGLRESATDLDTVEVFNTLSRCLNLSIDIMRQHMKSEGD